MTVVYYTANQLKPQFHDKTKELLLEAIGDLPLISVSQAPMDFGENIFVGQLRHHPYNIYRQLLIGAMAAKTKYIACAEDDVLYPKEHFTEARPEPGVFLYDLNRWGIHTWTVPVYSHRPGRECLHSMICERDTLMAALEERFHKYPTIEHVPPYPNHPDMPWFPEPGRMEKALGVTIQRKDSWKCSAPSVVFTHPESTGFRLVHGKRKAHGKQQVEVLKPWGRAENILKLYKESG